MTQENDNDGKKHARITQLGYQPHHKLQHRWNMKLDKINLTSNNSPSRSRLIGLPDK